jgi:hypothetical protein
MTAIVEALVVLGVVALVTYVVYSVVSGPDRGRRTTGVTTRWVATHYAVNHATHVVVRKVNPGTDDVLDEHTIAEIADSDPDFDGKFLQAMAEARARAALFESESDTP